jgi:hypothetical protein
VNEERWIGLIVIGGGVYFLVCSLWARNFPLYRLTVRYASVAFSESTAHRFYAVFGVILIVAGFVKLLIGI